MHIKRSFMANVNRLKIVYHVVVYKESNNITP